ncbi:HNH endonuclease [Serratia entomophila]|uniref:HNH endonuclease n=1 Tax=Serratia entomophila TaxID=42906 RepID=UPI0021B6ECDA|nr:HNH endonuclease [Serratia entomophila]
MNDFCKYFKYDETSPSGLINKITRSSKAKAGMMAGSLNHDGYYHVMLKRGRYQAHRIIYEMFHGEISAGDLIDHIDGNVNNNRISNLRLASHRDNTVNSKKQKGRNDLPKGISEATPGYYVAQVCYGAVRKRKFSRDLALIKKWVIAIRSELHGEFANHG